MSDIDWERDLKTLDLLRQQGLINGAWVDADGQDRLDVVAPHSLETVASVPAMGDAETERAVTAAAEAFTDWRRRTAKQRARALRSWHGEILRHRNDLAYILTAEQGKPLAEARGEIDYAAGFLDWFAEEALRVYGDVIPASSPNKRVFVQKHPVGVVAAITPWNFPAAMITRKAGAAIAAGCTVVLKPSELTPLVALAFGYLAEKSGLPSGVLNIVTGMPKDIGARLTSDPRVRKLTFTGSTAVGKLLAEQCAPTLKRLSLELGGNAAFMVFDDADLDLAVEAVMQSKFRNTGQTCVCANRIFVQNTVHDAFMRKLTERVRKLTTGPGLGGSATQGPLINQAALDKVERLVGDALEKGAHVMTGGERLGNLGAGYYFAPTILSGVTPAMAMAHEEIFGPVAPVFTFETEEEAVRLANDVPTGLAAYVATSSISRCFRLADEIEAGMIGLNTGAFSDPVVPFGGVKESGYGREGSKYGIEEYLDIRSITVGNISSAN